MPGILEAQVQEAQAMRLQESVSAVASALAKLADVAQAIDASNWQALLVGIFSDGGKRPPGPGTTAWQERISADAREYHNRTKPQSRRPPKP
jgi:hypothetical protein